MNAEPASASWAFSKLKTIISDLIADPSLIAFRRFVVFPRLIERPDLIAYPDLNGCPPAIVFHRLASEISG